MNQTDIHAAEETDRSGARRLRRQNSYEIRTFVLLENQRSNVRQLAHTVDDCKLNVWIVLRNLFHDRRLRETNADDQVEIAFGKRTHGRFDRVWGARFDVAQNYRQILRRPLYAFPRRRVERAIVLPADVKNDADLDLRGIVGRGCTTAA